MEDGEKLIEFLQTATQTEILKLLTLFQNDTYMYDLLEQKLDDIAP